MARVEETRTWDASIILCSLETPGVNNINMDDGYGAGGDVTFMKELKIYSKGVAAIHIYLTVIAEPPN